MKDNIIDFNSILNNRTKKEMREEIKDDLRRGNVALNIVKEKLVYLGYTEEPDETVLYHLSVAASVELAVNEGFLANGIDPDSPIDMRLIYLDKITTIMTQMYIDFIEGRLKK